ncbi:MAG: CBS domain-containing protein [Desulfuromonadales bacterium]|nr:CBS domain-containing protein [Desulfuromonadales bacterium]
MQTVADIMTKEVITVQRTTSLRELAELFESHNIGSIPVVDDKGTPIGIVTESDLIEQGRSLHIPTVISLFDWVIPLEGEKSLERDLQRLTAQNVGEIFSTELISVSPTDLVSKAADLMSDHRLHALPVLEGGKLTGIVARIDIIRSLIK